MWKCCLCNCSLLVFFCQALGVSAQYGSLSDIEKDVSRRQLKNGSVKFDLEVVTSLPAGSFNAYYDERFSSTDLVEFEFRGKNVPEREEVAKRSVSIEFDSGGSLILRRAGDIWSLGKGCFEKFEWEARYSTDSFYDSLRLRGPADDDWRKNNDVDFRSQNETGMLGESELCMAYLEYGIIPLKGDPVEDTKCSARSGGFLVPGTSERNWKFVCGLRELTVDLNDSNAICGVESKYSGSPVFSIGEVLREGNQLRGWTCVNYGENRAPIITRVRVEKVAEGKVLDPSLFKPNLISGMRAGKDGKLYNVSADGELVEILAKRRLSLPPIVVSFFYGLLLAFGVLMLRVLFLFLRQRVRIG